MNASTDTMSEPMTTGSTTGRGGNGSWIESPIDNQTYNVLMALASKLEAIDTYRKYSGDGDSELWRELAQDERRHADRLYEQLRQRTRR